MKFYERINIDKNKISDDFVEQQLIDWFAKAGLDRISNASLTFGSWFSKPSMSVYSYQHGYEVQVTIQPNIRWLIFSLAAWIKLAASCVEIFFGRGPSSIEIVLVMALAFAGPFLLFQVDRLRISSLIRKMFISLQTTHAVHLSTAPNPKSKINEDLEKLVEFNKQGILSSEEFQKAKDKLFSA